MIKSRQKTTLPSGATCTVRRISGDDFINGGLSPVIAEIKRAAKAATASEEMTDHDLKNMVKVTRMILFSCVGPITQSDGSIVKIVDKPFHQCAEDEITIEELDQEDANVIGAAVFRISGLTKEAAVAVAPFSSEPAPADNPSPGGEGIRPAAD